MGDKGPNLFIAIQAYYTNKCFSRLHFLFPSGNVSLQAKVLHCLTPFCLGLCVVNSESFYPVSHRDKNGKYASYTPLAPQSETDLKGQRGWWALPRATSWIPDTEERVWHWGKRSGSKRPLMVGWLLNYSQYLALAHHVSFSSFGEGSKRQGGKGMVKAEFSSSSCWRTKRGWGNHSSYCASKYNKNEPYTHWLDWSPFTKVVMKREMFKRLQDDIK